MVDIDSSVGITDTTAGITVNIVETVVDISEEALEKTGSSSGVSPGDAKSEKEGLVAACTMPQCDITFWSKSAARSC